MRILVAVDTTPQSAFVVQEVARLAGTTWADVTLLGIEPQTSTKNQSMTGGRRLDEQHPLVKSLRDHRDRFLALRYQLGEQEKRGPGRPKKQEVAVA